MSGPIAHLLSHRSLIAAAALALLLTCSLVFLIKPASAQDPAPVPAPTAPAAAEHEPTSQTPETAPLPLAVLKVTPADEAAAERLFRGPYDLLEANDGDSYFVLGDESVAQALRAEGFDVSIHEEISALAVGSFFEGYTPVAEAYADMYQLAAERPDLVKLVVYGRSWRRVQDSAAGHELIALCITKMRPNDCALNPDTDKPRMLLMAGIHAREIATPELAMRWVGHLVSTYDIFPETTALLDYNELWVIPFVNPDGSDIVAAGGTHGLEHRKNANNSQGNCTDLPPDITYGSYHFGVDLNRNFDYQWGNKDVASSISTTFCAETYIGASPASEPEASSLSTLLGQLFRDQRGPGPADQAPSTTTGLLLSLHSYQNAVLFPWGTNEPNAPNDPGLRTLAFRMSYFNRYATGRPQDIIRYTTSGATDEYSYNVYGIPSFTFEIGPTSGDCSNFLVEFRCVDMFWNRNYPAFLYAAKSARQGYTTGLGPTAVSLSLAIGSIAADQVTAELSSNFYDSAYGSAPASVARPQPRNVVAAEYYIDTPPWAGGKPCRMNLGPIDPLPGDAKHATARIDVSGLSEGRHRLFVRARNEAGHWGPVSVEWLLIDGSIELSGVCAPVNVLDVAPQSLFFDRNNANGSIAVNISNSSSHYVTDWQVSATAAWVKLSVASGSTPAQLEVSIDRSQLSGGSHAAALLLTNRNDPSQSITIPIEVTLPPDALVADQSSLAIDVGQGITSTVVELGNDNEGYSLAWSAQVNQPWLVVNPLSGTTPSTITVAVAPTAAELPPGTYTGAVTIVRTDPATAAAGDPQAAPLVIPVTLTIPPDELRVNTNVVRLNTYGGNPSAVLQIDNANRLKPIPWSAVASSQYLVLDTASGATPASLQLQFAPDRLLAEGVYTESIRLESAAVPGGQVVVVIEIVVDNNEIYLPVVRRNAAADLVVTQVQATPGGMTVTIRNDGALAATSPFWVDMYASPKPPPQRPNDIWADGRSRFGAVWAVRAVLLPGQSLSLALGDAMYDAALSRLPQAFDLGTTIVVQVDSAHTGTVYGGVQESHEMEPIGDYGNNLLTGRVGETAISATGASSAASAVDMGLSAPLPATTAMPARPQ
jgi:carboxypeptidase T